jgi:hypothetical protein
MPVAVVLSVVPVKDTSSGVEEYGSPARGLAAAVSDMRNGMYLAAETIRFLMKQGERTREGRCRRAQPLRAVARQRDELHPALGPAGIFEKGRIGDESVPH